MKKNFLKIRFLLLSVLFFCGEAGAQSNPKVYQGVILDEVMIKAVAGGFDVKAFIDRVKRDTSFYKAFKSLHLVGFTQYNDIQVEDKKGNTVASLNSQTLQERKNNCRSMKVIREKVTGDFYNKKKEYNYYTARLYAHLFFTRGAVCNENNIVGNHIYKGSQKYEEQLRVLIFNPGKRIRGIPGIGDNVAIFEEPAIRKYQFRLSRQEYQGEDCYIFTASPKKEHRNQVVINELKTWFRVSDFAILARDYSLSFRTLFYDFDVDMKVKLKKFRQYLLPYEVYYNGNWHAATKPREIVKFTAIFTDFQ